MTKQEAKELSFEVWQYLAKHPNKDKIHLPNLLWRRIMRFSGLCPLCELFKPSAIPPKECPGCPLKSCSDQSPYYLWSHADEYVTPDKDLIAIRKEAAQVIVKAIEAWRPE